MVHLGEKKLKNEKKFHKKKNLFKKIPKKKIKNQNNFLEKNLFSYLSQTEFVKEKKFKKKNFIKILKINKIKYGKRMLKKNFPLFTKRIKKKSVRVSFLDSTNAAFNN